MDLFFGKEFTGEPFELFGGMHIAALAVVCAAIAFLIYLRAGGNERLNDRVRWLVAVLLIGDEVLYHLWNIHIHEWTLQKMLPLHLCSLFVWLSAAMLLTKSRRIYEFAYFLGIGGALQALLTPDIGIYNFPHFRFFQVFLSHGLIVIAALYMTIVEGYRPHGRSFGRVFLWLNVYMLFVFGVDLLVGGNYLFLLHKPETPSLLDLLGPWPFYILASEFIALALFMGLYSPFLLLDARRKS